MLQSRALNAARKRTGEAAVFLKDVDAVVYVRTEASVLYARAYVGKASKTAWHYRFKSDAAIAKQVEALRVRLLEKEQRKAERAATRNAFVHTLQVGDVLVASWGYEQTNVDFFQVTARVGTKLVEVRAIDRKVKHTGWEQGEARPQPDVFVGEAKRYRVAHGNVIRIADYARAYPLEFETVNGVKVYRPSNFTSYA